MQTLWHFPPQFSTDFFFAPYSFVLHKPFSDDPIGQNNWFAPPKCYCTCLSNLYIMIKPTFFFNPERLVTFIKMPATFLSLLSSEICSNHSSSALWRLIENTGGRYNEIKSISENFFVSFSLKYTNQFTVDARVQLFNGMRFRNGDSEWRKTLEREVY